MLTVKSTMAMWPGCEDKLPNVLVVTVKKSSFTPRDAADLRETSGQYQFAGGPVPLGTPPTLHRRSR